jgi:hypothetical protein
MPPTAWQALDDLGVLTLVGAGVLLACRAAWRAWRRGRDQRKRDRALLTACVRAAQASLDAQHETMTYLENITDAEDLPARRALLRQLVDKEGERLWEASGKTSRDQ